MVLRLRRKEETSEPTGWRCQNKISTGVRASIDELGRVRTSHSLDGNPCTYFGGKTFLNKS